ncbi:Tumor susceptibility gene 101 protein [Curvularia clavata]|uniref:Tumor susceptibility gene 101 protein n=1 Tax=Curvularia clavata TaxID=95742 RepID=A0A9Q8ZD23_CURCL|nr:Tumor susceptibility gene 101 protein [Curvularia clavata]
MQVKSVASNQRVLTDGQEYLDVNRTYHDAAETLANYPSLTVRTEPYTYENGASALLLLLTGTLPVTFRGATYGFPVAIWVPHAYPREPPIVYVTPSQDMVLRPGQHVSTDGKVYHPYLAQWAQYWDKSTLFDFLAVLRGVFAKEPPVRSRQQQPQQNAPAQQTPPPVPPPPAEWRRTAHATPISSPAPALSNQAPPPPPKPPKPHEQQSATPQTPHDRYSKPPPLPPHPPQHAQSHQQQQPQRNRYDGPSNWQQQQQPPLPPPPPREQQPMPSAESFRFGMNPVTAGPRPQHPQVQAYNHPQQSFGMDSPVSPMTPNGQMTASHFPGSGPSQPSPLQQTNQQQGPPAPRQQHSGQPAAPQHYQQYPPGYAPFPNQQYPQQQPQQAPPAPKPPVDLLDDSLEVTLPSQSGNQVPLPVPPVPPNPEKDALLRALSQTLVSQINQTVSSNMAAIAPLRAQQAALQNAHARLQAELGELQQLEAALASNEQVLKGAMVEADRVMEDARRRKAPDVDDVLVAPTVVGGQLYTLAAEEKGIADALFVLGRALDRGRITPDVFVKQTRSLAREQFLKKALIKKIARGMALDEYQLQ